MRITRIAAPLALFGLLPACVSIGGGDAPEQLIGLTSQAVAPAGASSTTGKASTAIAVMEAETEDRLNAKRVPVRIDETGIAYLENAFLVDKPTRLMQHLLAETLRAQTGRLVFEGIEPGAEPRIRLHGRLIEMGYDARDSSVTVTYDAIRIEEGREVVSRRFSSTVPGIAPDAAAVAPALNQAANTVAMEIANWIAQ
ncbi:ABC-type transport auxiliary lipoprotein family protein [Croceicoccus sp. YJ47]|uniref:ABC-type transport auxiliary lipoprotein family protein n=1 Tax=Croceicoccus sp. YJ47 TaxID=2798724 RepID=UPI001924F467|nr:ABC-type transport auxiliary lipoprotein family protein [Croceicoccus sp. YJ47]QQN74808.1 membrane integrity-associated transporter subunit PqiC [Croceicoccus sp. YJ47]